MSNETVRRQAYPLELTDVQWSILEPLVSQVRTARGGRPRPS